MNGNNEQECRNTISYATNWCEENHVDLSVTKTKEMIFDNRKKMNHNEPVVSNNTNVTIFTSYKCLGVVIQDNLKWDEHITSQVKKADHSMYFVRRLRKLRMDEQILCHLYNSVVSSVLVYAIPCWFH